MPGAAGQLLFQYINGSGEPQPVTSADVNDYIREGAGGDFTAKHFRTWAASVIFFGQMLEKDEGRRLSLATALEQVAEALGKTPAISRNSSVHPILVDAVRNRPRDPLNGAVRPRPRRGLSRAEAGLLLFLKKRTGKTAA